jgi:hypothetical protein
MTGFWICATGGIALILGDLFPEWSWVLFAVWFVGAYTADVVYFSQSPRPESRRTTKIILSLVGLAGFLWLSRTLAWEVRVSFLIIYLLACSILILFSRR